MPLATGVFAFAVTVTVGTVLRRPGWTIVVGMAASMGALIASQGEKGKRFALPNAKIMMHQPSSGYEGTQADIEIGAREILRVRGDLDAMLAKATGHSVDKIHKDTDRDFWMTAKEAKAYGLIDSIIARQG